jgi:hypothetical protein
MIYWIKLIEGKIQKLEKKGLLPKGKGGTLQKTLTEPFYLEGRSQERAVWY